MNSSLMNDLFDEIYQHETARVYGQVKLGVGSSLWINVAVRAEMHEVRIGRYTNVQDFVMLHVGMRTDTVIGDFCSIAHHAVVHGATIGDNCLIGVGAIVMDGCVVGDNSIIDAACYLAPGTVIPANSIVKGNPGVVTKTRNNYVANRLNAIYYNINAEHYRRGDYRAWASETIKNRMKSYFRALSDELKGFDSGPLSSEGAATTGDKFGNRDG